MFKQHGRKLPPGKYNPALGFAQSFATVQEALRASAEYALTNEDYAKGGPLVIVVMPASDDMAGPRRYACIPKHILTRIINTTVEDMVQGGAEIRTQ